ncbi:MAG: CCA tRNA nucleotidyltransferase [Alphaproteobacteria bacterium]|nr:CCA tRNA nucleotidyltransferase [Alphaproteobacteria bacterium]
MTASLRFPSLWLCGKYGIDMVCLTASWLSLPTLQYLFELFENEGAILRLVGGSVRDGLLGLPVNDIDLAVDRDPHWVTDLLEKNHIKVIPTGIDHGTITAILEKRPYQITTLRVDIKTFGRKAQVVFTEDWVQDALRRDFTINALYADKSGHLFDPTGGLEDLKARHIRFIGESSLRIQEDYLRILRFFRFSARFGRKPFDESGLKACEKYASHLTHLARERVTEEFLKILELPSPLYTLDRMKETGVLNYILHPKEWEDLAALVSLEKEAHLHPSALIRLAAFHSDLKEVKNHLRLSKKQEETLFFLTKKHPSVTKTSYKQQVYLWGKAKTFDLALLQAAHRLAIAKISLKDATQFLKHIHALLESWSVPLFPLMGRDLISRGIKEGKEIGTLLKTVETWWIAKDLQPDYKACLAYLATLRRKQ